MSETTPDRTHPDHNWTGDGSVASTDDLAAVVAHVKAWAMREIDKLKAALVEASAPPIPKLAHPPSTPVETASPPASSGA